MSRADDICVSDREHISLCVLRPQYRTWATVLFRWFEEVAPLKGAWKSDQNESKRNQITYRWHLPKVWPVLLLRWGSILDLSGFFGSICVRENATGKILGTLNFRVLSIKKFKFRSAENMGYGCRNGSASEKVQKFGERSILMKCRAKIQWLARFSDWPDPVASQLPMCTQWEKIWRWLATGSNFRFDPVAIHP